MEIPIDEVSRMRLGNADVSFPRGEAVFSPDVFALALSHKAALLLREAIGREDEDFDGDDPADVEVELRGGKLFFGFVVGIDSLGEGDIAMTLRPDDSKKQACKRDDRKMRIPKGTGKDR